jgi:hypothetical protein
MVAETSSDSASTTDTESECASAVKIRSVGGSKTRSIGSVPTGTCAMARCASRSTTVTQSLREQATYARRLAASTATPSGSRPTGISAIFRECAGTSIRQAAPTA